MIIQVSEKHATSEKPMIGNDVLLRNPYGGWANVTYEKDNLGLPFSPSWCTPILYSGEAEGFHKSCPPFPSKTVVTIVQE